MSKKTKAPAGKPAIKVNHGRLQIIINYRGNRKTHSVGLPDSKQNRVLTQLNACCSWAMKSKLIAVNPFVGMAAGIVAPRGKDDGEDIDPFSPDERERIIAALKLRGDDYIAAKGVKALDRLYTNRKEFKPPAPPKPKRVTSGDTLLEIGKTAIYFHTANKVPYADIWIEGNRHTCAVRSKAFRMWLSGEFYKSEGIICRSLASQFR